MIPNINPHSLLEARNKLKKVEQDKSINPRWKEKQRQDQEAREVTKIGSEEERIAYYLRSGIDGWCESGISTFPTSIVRFERREKEVLVHLFGLLFPEEKGNSLLGTPGNTLIISEDQEIRAALLDVLLDECCFPEDGDFSSPGHGENCCVEGFPNGSLFSCVEGFPEKTRGSSFSETAENEKQRETRGGLSRAEKTQDLIDRLLLANSSSRTQRATLYGLSLTREMFSVQRLRGSLRHLEKRLEDCILEKASHTGKQKAQNEKAFVKLTTRSPKDSVSALQRAGENFRKQVRSEQERRRTLNCCTTTIKSECEINSNIKGNNADEIESTRNFCTDNSVGTESTTKRTSTSSLDLPAKISHNDRWHWLAECNRLALSVSTGREAIRLLADSRRVFEDLTTDLESSAAAGACSVDLVVRTFDARVTPATEFRGFVWAGKFVGVGQYFHQLYFPELHLKRTEIERDLVAFYEKKMRPALEKCGFLEKIPCFMMDLVWLGSSSGKSEENEENEVLLTEINPFDGEALGAFPGSTGLFCWEKDRELMMGLRDRFELRLVPEEQQITDASLKLKNNLSSDWKKIVYSC